MSATSNVLSFPKQSLQRLVDAVRRCPALAVVAVHLPCQGHVAHRRCLEVLLTLFHLQIARLQASFQRARSWVEDVDGDRDRFTNQELANLKANRNYRRYYELWQAEVWSAIDDEFVLQQARFYVALYWHLYKRDLLDQANLLSRAETIPATVVA